jgi:hypothetical protein
MINVQTTVPTFSAFNLTGITGESKSHVLFLIQSINRVLKSENSIKFR